MSKIPLLLLPPSEGKAAGGSVRLGRDHFSASLSEPRAVLVNALGTWLRSASVNERQRVLKVRGDLFVRATQAMSEYVAGTGLVMPAWQRYEGVVWSHLDPASLNAAQRRKILIPSGIYGVNRADDTIADYRLTMNVSVPGVGAIAAYWRHHLGAAFAATRGPVVSLLPNEHLAAVDMEGSALGRRLLHIGFVSYDGAKAAGHDAKAVKGIVARHILQYGLTDFGAFAWMGWTVTRRNDQWLVRAPSTRTPRS